MERGRDLFFASKRPVGSLVQRETRFDELFFTVLCEFSASRKEK